MRNPGRPDTRGRFVSNIYGTNVPSIRGETGDALITGLSYLKLSMVVQGLKFYKHRPKYIKLV